jgi:antitoxin ParD1/3/4
MNVSLTEELENFVQRRVASGLYSTASEVVREALRLLSEQEQVREIRMAELRKQIAKGLESAEAGRLVDGEEAMAGILGKLREGRLAPK